MADTPPTGSQSRRHFILQSLSSLAFLSMQGCAGGLAPSSRTATPPGVPGLDHPLATLALGRDSLLTSYMNIREVETPVHVAEGRSRWHRKGDHPYAFRVSSEETSIAWEEHRSSLQTPPLGIRSAVPLGGLGAGTVELRADGRLADWQIFNNAPGSGEKIEIPDAFFAIRTSRPDAAAEAFTLRTRPPDPLPAIEGMRYAGAFPVSRLQLVDERLPLQAALYAYSAIDLHETGLQRTPAIIFSFLLSNPTDVPIETSVMYNQPNFIEGTYRTERGLVLSRSGTAATAGELCLTFASTLSVSSTVSSDLEEIWEAFEEEGGFEDTLSMGLFAYGALCSSFVIEPGASRTVSMVLSWRFPNRYIAGENVGNAYASSYASASEAGDHVIRQLPQVWRSLSSWNAIASGNSLPAPVQRGFTNSLAQLYKTTFCTADGRWRAWDSFSDARISSLASTLYRALPALFVAPEILRSLLRAYAMAQTGNGRLPADLGYGQRFPLDHHDTYADVHAIPSFFILVHAYFLYTGDEAFLKELWPHIEKALYQQIAITTPEGLPTNYPALGDWESMAQEGVLLHDSVLHLTGLQAVVQMATVLENANVAGFLSRILSTGLKNLQIILGSPNGFRLSSAPVAPPASQDLLLGFIWDGLLNFDNLVGSDQLDDFLDHIHDENAPAIRRDESRGGIHAAPGLAPAMAINWAALHLQATGTTRRAFDAMSQLFEHLENNLADNWGHYERIMQDEDLPLSNPHHVSSLSIWYLVLAISGQRYDALHKKLSFNPKGSAGTRIPFFTPGARGMLTLQRSGRYLIEIIAGRLELERLEIGEEIVYRDILLEEGQVFQLRS